MTNLDSVLKSRDITLPTKVCTVKTTVFPVVMYGCESWTIKKTWVLESWCSRIVVLEKTLVPWTARRSKQSILKEINPLNIHWKDCCWSWSSNTLATWYKEPTHWKRPWCWQRSKAKEEGGKGWDSCIASPTQGTWIWANSQETVKDREAWCVAVHAVTKSRTRLKQLNNSEIRSSEGVQRKGPGQCNFFRKINFRLGVWVCE